MAALFFNFCNSCVDTLKCVPQTAASLPEAGVSPPDLGLSFPWETLGKEKGCPKSVGGGRGGEGGASIAAAVFLQNLKSTCVSPQASAVWWSH